MWKWYVKANIDVGNYTPAVLHPSIMSNDSLLTGNGTFNVGFFGRPPGCCR
jgi:hypothetical protein